MLRNFEPAGVSVVNFGLIGRTFLCCVFVAVPLLLTSSDVANRDGYPEETRSLDGYGINTALFSVHDDRVKRNQTLGGILESQGISRQTIATVSEKAEGIFDPRRLRVGDRYRIYKDTITGDAVLIVYRASPERYVVFNVRDSVHVWDGVFSATVTRRSAMGSINSSPYQTLVDLRANPSLAAELARVFAWQIDFYRVQPGDRFHVLYDERDIHGTFVGLDIVAARFEHAGREYFAFRFDDGQDAAYYDEKGTSMQRAFLRAPIEYTRISSRYSARRFHPVLRHHRPHLGTDFAAPAGTPIHATGDGVVTHASYTRGNGRYVKIRHNDTYSTAYLHMSRIADGIRAGVRVKQKDVIGYVGSSGLATGPHVCYRFWVRGRQVDPLTIEMPVAEPIPEAHFAAFAEKRDALLPLLVLPLARP